MIVIVWAGWKGRAGQLWAWIYTRPWLTAGTVFLGQKIGRCASPPVQEAGCGACASACTRRCLEHTSPHIYPRPRDETAQWQLSRCSPMQWKRQREGPRLYPRHRPPPLLFSLLVRTDVLLSHRLQLGNLYNNRPSWFSSHHYFEGVLEFEGILRGLRKFDDGILNGKSDYYVLILSIYIYCSIMYYFRIISLVLVYY